MSLTFPYGDYGRCEAWSHTGGRRCRQPAIGDHGKCYYHGGLSSGPRDTSDTKMNGLTHGATAEPTELVDHLDSEALAFVRELRDAYLDRYAGDPGPEVETDVLLACIIVWQEWSATSELLADGLSQDHSAGVDDHGRPVIIANHSENHLAATRSRLIRDSSRLLDRHGLLEDPASEAASAQRTVAEVFAEAASREGSGDRE